ncbi:hypothetical protein F2P56_013167 [Juglans regia]|uniref:Uncharacterized protein LOC108998401 n=2 Tax=Juglans regia TaxID=51240 RepID=A0A2I4FFS7_JUGRE|nr:uncharacterized protein LOC108998401 [Juglans regia]KAF5469067.1 hypothetical protein F2P56_013167 [Juglans regia]
MCSETSPPRLSFSHDVGQSEVVPIEHNLNRRDSSLLDPDFDFEFRISSSSFEQETCPADELFSNGVLLPVQVKERIDAAKEIHSREPRSKASLPPLPCDNSSKKESMKEVMIMNSELAQKQASKSFWGFRRSTSLNADSKRSLLCSLPLLLRSNSTGSVSNPKRAALKDVHKQNSQKQASNSMSRSSPSSYVSAMQQKPPLKKNYGGSLNGVRISPILNIVPPPYISKRTENLFGLGSLLRDRKDKRSTK